MRGNTIGKMLSMTTFGESHGKAMGVVLDGVPSNLLFCLEDLKKELKRRAPGHILGTTSRKEEDEPEILSGIFNDKTLGSPICVVVKNNDQKSSDYDSLLNEYRPGHADQTTIFKYGIRDHRGSGRASGRETLSRVIAGYFAGLIIPEVKLKAYNIEIGKFHHDILIENLDQDFAPYQYCDPSKNKEIENYLMELKQNGDSVGGKVRLVIDHCPKGLGEPVFNKLKSDLAAALMSIGACTAFSYGIGEQFSNLKGTEATSSKNNFGGIEGGISNGERIVINLTFRAPSTVGDKAKQGRHDPCLLPRVIPVVEAMARFVIADHYLRQKAYEI
jgi:chorismate synthase